MLLYSNLWFACSLDVFGKYVLDTELVELVSNVECRYIGRSALRQFIGGNHVALCRI